MKNIAIVFLKSNLLHICYILISFILHYITNINNINTFLPLLPLLTLQHIFKMHNVDIEIVLVVTTGVLGVGIKSRPNFY